MPNVNDFKLGDLVQLKSGGPQMTVYFLSEKENYIYCTWYSSDENKFKEHKFKPDCLDKG